MKLWEKKELAQQLRREGYRKNVLYNGTLKITICDVRLLRKILGWIEYFGTGDIPA